MLPSVALRPKLRGLRFMTQPHCLRFRLALAAGALLACSVSAFSQVPDARFTLSDAYVIDDEFFELPPGRRIGATSGFVIHPDGSSIWVFERCGANDCVGSDLAPIMQFDLQGRLLTSFGANRFVRPHGLHVDRDGNVWVTDDRGPDGEDPRRDARGTRS